MFHNGHTAGFFQFESDGITGLAKRLAPITDFETLIHINALYRPGPLDSGMVETYARRYRKEEPVVYLHPKEAEITEKTLGLPIFQEQVMAYFVRLAGFSWPEADNMRKIIAKSKGVEKLEERRPEFVSGCAGTVGMSLEVANMIYDNICAFGRYGFGRSHAACYSLISYLTAWAKIPLSGRVHGVASPVGDHRGRNDRQVCKGCPENGACGQGAGCQFVRWFILDPGRQNDLSPAFLPSKGWGRRLPR